VVRAMAWSDHCRWVFDAQMSTDLAEGDLELPVQDEPGDNLQRINGEVGAEHGLGGELAAWVADEDPADSYGGKPVWYHPAVPERSWMGRSCSPYQRTRRSVVHAVAGSAA
jgi:hypothetical protein